MDTGGTAAFVLGLLVCGWVVWYLGWGQRG